MRGDPYTPRQMEPARAGTDARDSRFDGLHEEAKAAVGYSANTLRAVSQRYRTAYTEEESRKNFEMASKFVVPGVPTKSRLLTMPLAHEAGGTEFHPGGKHWESQSDPEWRAMAEWVKNAAATDGRGLR